MSFKYNPIFMFDEETDKIFDIIHIGLKPPINDYTLSSNYEVKIEISSINELKEYIGCLFTTVNNAIKKLSSKGNVIDYSIDEADGEYIIHQVIFDILFDSYLNSQGKKLINRSDYSEYVRSMIEDVGDKIPDSGNTIRIAIERTMIDYSNMIANSDLRNEIVTLGYDNEKYIEYMKPPVKGSDTQFRSKFVWDFFLYNSYMLPGLQYERDKISFSDERKSYTLDNKIKDITTYMKFSDILLSEKRIQYNDWKKGEITVLSHDEHHKVSAEDYFIKIMEYYYLESYKRIDFMLKYAEYIKDISKKKIDDNYLLILKRFHPMVMCPMISNNNAVQWHYKCKYYKPLLIAEATLLENVFIHKLISIEKINQILINYQILRAKIYELFKFHANFNSEDYEEIKNFITENYNLISFHNSVNQDLYQNKDKDCKNAINKFILLNKYFFPNTTKRKYSLPSKNI